MKRTHWRLVTERRPPRTGERVVIDHGAAGERTIGTFAGTTYDWPDPETVVAFEPIVDPLQPLRDMFGITSIPRLPEPQAGYFEDDRHALYAGWVLGCAHRVGLNLQPVVDDEGNYTDRVKVRLGSAGQVELLVPPPPDDWKLS